MRRSAAFALPLLVCLSLAACDDFVIDGGGGNDGGGGGGDQITLSVTWLEWPVAAAPDTPFGVRVVGYTDWNIDRVRVRVRATGDTLTIEPYGITRPCPDLCRQVFDTLVQVPGMPAPTVRTIWLRSPIGFGATQSLRLFGPLSLTAAIPMDYTTRAAGRATWTTRSPDCYEINPALGGSPSPRRFTSHDPPDSATIFPFIYGRVHSTQAAICGTVTAPVIAIDSIR